MHVQEEDMTLAASIPPPLIVPLCNVCQTAVTAADEACQSMGYLYHAACFACCCCGRMLCGKAFYFINNKVFCEDDYKNSGLQEMAAKCTACGHLILDTILKAMDKTYHPGCFRCTGCNVCLDNQPFIINSNGLVFCIKDYHMLNAPVCSVCREPILPDEGSEETIRIVAMDKDFHVDCYHCQDCGMQLTDELDKRCHPFNDRLLCRSCHTRHLSKATDRQRTGTTSTHNPHVGSSEWTCTTDKNRLQEMNSKKGIESATKSLPRYFSRSQQNSNSLMVNYQLYQQQPRI
jgi:LIM domain-containing protein